MQSAEPACAREAAGQFRRRTHYLVKERLGRAIFAAQLSAVHHQANTGFIRLQRNKPEPGAGPHHQNDVAHFIAGRHRHAGKMSKHSHFAVFLIHMADALARAGEGRAAGGIEQEPARCLVLAAAFRAISDRCGCGVDAVAGHRGALTHFRAAFGSVPEQQFVKLGALHLESRGVLGEPAFGENEPRPRRATTGGELRPAFYQVTSRLDLLPHANLLEDLPIVGQQRLADVKPREMLALQHQHRLPRARQQRCRRRAGRPAADDDDIPHLGIHDCK